MKQYVFTVERDTYEPTQDSRPIVWEQFLDAGASDFAPVHKKAEEITLDGRYGKARVARLAYVDEDADLLVTLELIAALHDFEMTTIEAAGNMYEARCLALQAIKKAKESK